jgi:hypothetical protein
MRIKLTVVQNAKFENAGSRYVCWTQPKSSKRTVWEPAPAAVKGNFINGRVELLKMANNGIRIEEIVVLSKDFCDEHYDGLAYSKALGQGFEVVPGAEEAAQLLIEQQLALEV